jgi:beclin 1
LCPGCFLRLREEVDARLAEAEAEGRAYRDALAALSRQDADEPLPEEEFAAEMRRLRSEEQAERARVAELSQQLAAVRCESVELEAAERELEALEERHWHDLNAARAEGRGVAEASASLHHRIHVASAQLELLKRSNVYNDAFHIWHQGPFGTISGFRLGRTPEIPVGWEEVNAAWGQAVLLLHTMASVEGVQFQECELLPMGSTPRVECRKSRSVYELYGPVSQIVRATYDTGMVLYLGCLQEFATYARGMDLDSERRSKPFKMPYAIEGDKVNGATVRLRFNREERWTKALKFMLTNLKVLLAWHTNVRGHGVVARR